jgi:hypothetical protein
MFKQLVPFFAALLVVLPVIGQEIDIDTVGRGPVKYYLNTPKGWDVWIAVSSAIRASWLYEYSKTPNVLLGDPNIGVKTPLADIIAKEGHQYTNKEVVILVSPTYRWGDDTLTRGCNYVRSVHDKWEGWVYSSLVEPTEETEVILAKQAAIQAQKDADEAKYEAARRADEIKAANQRKKQQDDEKERVRLRRVKIQMACGVIYQNTINKKVSDLTVREEEQVRACQALGFYN